MLAERGAGAAEVALAGGFGMNVNPASAGRIGLIPPELAARTVPLGNAAVKGVAAALSRAGRAELGRIARRCRHLELSASPDFNRLYVEAMTFGEA